MKPWFNILGIVAALVAAAPAAAQDADPDTQPASPERAQAEALEAEVEAPPEDATLEATEAEVVEAEATEAVLADAAAETAAGTAAETTAETTAETATESDPEPQPSDAPPEGGQTASEPATADPEPQPSDAPPEAAERAGPQFTFANSFFTWTNAATTHTFAPGAQLTYDPTYVMSFSLTPRFYLTDSTFLWLNQAMSLELTDSNGTAHNREPMMGDTLLDIRQILPWEGFVFQLSGRVGFPLSKASQAAGRIMQTGLGLTIARPIPEAAGLTLALTGGYRRWWATRNVSNAEESYAGNCLQPSPGEPPVCTQAGGTTNARDILIGGLTMNIAPFSGFTVSFSGFFLGTYNYDVGDGNIPINGGNVTLEDDSPSHWRAFTYFALAVAYDVQPWLNLQLGIQNSGVVAPLFDSSGNATSPFSPATQVFLSTTIGLDALFGEIVGGGEDDGLTPEERQRRRQGLASTGRRSAF